MNCNFWSNFIEFRNFVRVKIFYWNYKILRKLLLLFRSHQNIFLNDAELIQTFFEIISRDNLSDPMVSSWSSLRLTSRTMNWEPGSKAPEPHHQPWPGAVSLNSRVLMRSRQATLKPSGSCRFPIGLRFYRTTVSLNNMIFGRIAVIVDRGVTIFGEKKHKFILEIMFLHEKNKLMQVHGQCFPLNQNCQILW
jgi:hypothetical protein